MDKIIEYLGKFDGLKTAIPYIASALAAVIAFIHSDDVIKYFFVAAFPLLVLVTIEKFLQFRFLVDPSFCFSVANFIVIGELSDKKNFKGRIVFNIANESRRSIFYKVDPIVISCLNNAIKNSDDYTNSGGKIRPMMHVSFRSPEFEIDCSNANSINLDVDVKIHYGFSTKYSSSISEKIKIQINFDHSTGQFNCLIWNE